MEQPGSGGEEDVTKRSGYMKIHMTSPERPEYVEDDTKRNTHTCWLGTH